MADVTSTSGVNNDPNGYYSTSTTSTAASGNLDKNAFLKMLVTQLQHQDPMNPMEDKDFIAQMAQFSSLEQMQQMNDKLDAIAYGNVENQLTYATTFVGRTVTAQGSADETATVGVVDAVVFENGQPFLSIGGKTFALNSVTRVE